MRRRPGEPNPCGSIDACICISWAEAARQPTRRGNGEKRPCSLALPSVSPGPQASNGLIPVNAGASYVGYTRFSPRSTKCRRKRSSQWWCAPAADTRQLNRLSVNASCAANAARNRDRLLRVTPTLPVRREVFAPHARRLEVLLTRANWLAIPRCSRSRPGKAGSPTGRTRAPDRSSWRDPPRKQSNACRFARASPGRSRARAA